jgi:hypothetical protein
MRSRGVFTRISFPVFVLVAVAACTSVQTRPAPSSATLSAAELRSAGASNVYDAINRLRPHYFMSRGATSFLNEPARPIVVIVHRMIVGGVEQLRNIDPREVRAVRRLNAAQVYQLTGHSAPSGGVEIVMGP